MTCPYCNREMEKGASTFRSVHGFDQIILNYNGSAGSGKKGFWSIRAIEKSGDEVETFYCPTCKKIFPVYQTL